MPYPQWSYFPRNVRPPAWAIAFVEVVENAEAKISTVAEKTGLSSDAVLSELRSGLLGLGYVGVRIPEGRVIAGRFGHAASPRAGMLSGS